MFNWLKGWYAVCLSYVTLWYLGASSLLWGTELELNGIGVIKDSAEILANSFSAMPSKSTAIALIGLIVVSQGIFLLGKGLVSVICSPNDRSLLKVGGAECLIGLFFSIWGFSAAIYSSTIAKLLFS